MSMEKQDIKVNEPIKEKKGLSKSGIVLIIGIAIIAIPVIVFAAILLTASLQTGSPVLGDRFKNDLSTEIKSADIKTVETKLKAISNVETVSVEEPQTGTLKVFVDVADSLTEEEVVTLSDSAYKAVTEVLPVSTYFSSNGSERMYDLSINVYTSLNSDSKIYVVVTKNAKMNEPSTQIVSKALDPELAEQLRTGETGESE